MAVSREKTATTEAARHGGHTERKNLRRLHVAVVTGTRAEFGIFRPVLDAIAGEKSLRMQLIVTGMHLQRRFGNTIDDIRAAGYPIAATVPMYGNSDSPAEALARGTMGLARAYRRLNSDLVFVLGDRLEILAAASAALAEQKLIAHLHGGETAPGQWDEQIRHAISKMAHVHFAATAAAGRRIRQMGENPASIHVTGAPALDLATRAAARMKATRSRPVRPLLVLHPSTPDDALEYRHTMLVLRALLGRFPGTPITAVGPNNDPGHRGILRAYRDCREQVQLLMSVPQDLFWGLMHEHSLLVGNSSSGIIEAATFGCAVINIGPRQSGRERSANVLDVPFSPGAISAAIDRVLSDKPLARRIALAKNVYGDGRAAPRIAAALRQIARRPPSPVKRFYDLR
jgi:UDP-hydrolysing UDP-N-acetyl-D-glucosamine 2-epimerase